MTASWLQSTGAGDDVLEVTHDGVVTSVNAAKLRNLADCGRLREVFGAAAPEVETKLELYLLAHEPARARASEDAARAALARRRGLDAELAEARAQGLIA